MIAAFAVASPVLYFCYLLLSLFWNGSLLGSAKRGLSPLIITRHISPPERTITAEEDSITRKIQNQNRLLTPTSFRSDSKAVGTVPAAPNRHPLAPELAALLLDTCVAQSVSPALLAWGRPKPTSNPTCELSAQLTSGRLGGRTMRPRCHLSREV